MKTTVLSLLVSLMIIAFACQQKETENTSGESTEEAQGKFATKRYCYALDLKNDSALIGLYKKYHTPDGIWKEIPVGIRESGVSDMEIYLLENHMFLIVEIPDSLDLDVVWEKMGQLDRQSEWQGFTWQFQQALPMAMDDEKWILMDRIFDLDEH